MINNSDSHISKVTDTEELLETKKKSWVQRTFGPMEKGSVRSSIITLMSCAMGAGMLAYPCILLGVVLMTVCCFISRLSMHMLLITSFKTRINTYPALVESTLGLNIKRAFEINIIIYMFGILVCQQIIFTSFMWDAFHRFGMDTDKEALMRALLSLGFMVFNLPISMLRDVYQLRYFAQLQLAVVVYIIFAIFVYFFTTLNGSNNVSDIRLFKVDINIFSSFASTFYGYITHQMVLPLKSELQQCSYKRMNKVCTRGSIATYFIYLVIMVCGYMTWYSDTKTLIIDNYDSMFFTVAKMLMALALFFSVPINLNPLRSAFLGSFNLQDSQKAFVISTVSFQLGSGLLAYVYPNVKSGFGFLGGFLGLNMVVVVPCWIYVKTFGWNTRSVTITIICVGSTIIGWLGAVFSQIYKE